MKIKMFMNECLISCYHNLWCFFTVKRTFTTANPTITGNVLLDNEAENTESHGLNPIGITLILGALLFLAMHAIGPSPVPFIAPGDLFDNEPKAAASSLSASVTWIGMLTVALTFPLCQSYLKSFMVVPFIVVIVCQIVPFYIYFPETKGMSNSKIASLFQIENPWRHAIGLKNPSQSYDTAEENSINNGKEDSHCSSVETLSISTISSDINNK